MKKRVALFSIAVLVLIISLNFASASYLSDFFKKITGVSTPSSITLAPEEGLIAYYKFDDSFLDSVGNNHGTNNGAGFDSGKIGARALRTNLNQYVSLGTSSTLNPTDKMTISVWIKPDNMRGFDPIIERYSAQVGNRSYFLRINKDKIPEFIIYTNPVNNTTEKFARAIGIGTVPTNNWTYIVGTYDKNTGMKIYVNGIIESSAAAIGPIQSTTEETTVAGTININNISQWFIGRIDDLRIYNRELLASEIYEMYKSGLTDSPPTPPIANKTCSDFGYEGGTIGNLCPNGVSYDLSKCYNTKYSCTDIDGEDYYTKGEIKFNLNLVYGLNCFNKSTSGGGGGTISKVDSCQGRFLIEQICVSDNKTSFIGYECPNGCQDGACLPNVNNTICTDTDGGINYNKAGTVSDSQGNVYKDFCLESDGSVVETGLRLREHYCGTSNYAYEYYDCPNGCKDGACLSDEETDVCKSLLESLSSSNELGDGFRLIDSDQYKDDSDYWSGSATFNLYSYENEEKQKGILAAVIVLDDKNELIKDTKWLKSILGFTLISGDTIYTNQLNKVYVIDAGYGKIMLWYNKNVAVYILLANQDYLTESTQSINNIDDFISALQDNKFDSIIDYSDPDYILLKELSTKLLNECPSKVSGDQCIPKWERKVEPVVCPEYGRQTVVIRDRLNCRTDVTEEQKICSPGICSGCYIPRWIGYDSRGDNICIPYTTRLKYEESDLERVPIPAEESEDEYSISCTSDTSAKLELIKEGEVIASYDIFRNKEYLIPEEYIGEEINFRVVNIQCREDSINYVDIEILDSFNAYCDIDGNLKRQRVKTDDGNWAQCQNSYECDSNLCSGGECVEINDAIRQAKGLKSIIIRVVCRIAHIFDEGSYNVCVGDYLGYSPS